MHLTRSVISLRQRSARVAVLLAIIVVSASASLVRATETVHGKSLLLALDDLQEQVIRRDWLETLPRTTGFDIGRLTAFEDHAYFTYLQGTGRHGKSHGALAAGAGEPETSRRVIFLRPGIVVIDDQIAARGKNDVDWILTSSQELTLEDQMLTVAGKGGTYHVRAVLPEAANWQIGRTSESLWTASRTVLLPQNETPSAVRIVHVLSTAEGEGAVPPNCAIEHDSDGLRLELIEHGRADKPGRVVRMWLPHGPAGGKLEIVDRDGRAFVRKRLLPTGILPPGLEAAQRRLQWDLAYRLKGGAVWDTNQASSELRRLVENGEIKPGRIVEIGCGTGNDAIYLASRGFDVTAIDISPTALSLAEEKAENAGVTVRWLLADILQPPQLKRFDLVYDRGCYHEVRQHDAEAYVAAVRSLTHEGSQILILAASASPDAYWRFEGPPRVKESEIRRDFAADFRVVRLREFRFDPVPPERQGALAWSILLQRETNDGAVDEAATQ